VEAGLKMGILGEISRLADVVKLRSFLVKNLASGHFYFDQTRKVGEKSGQMAKKSGQMAIFKNKSGHEICI
jgi:hypothetical protein